MLKSHFAYIEDVLLAKSSVVEPSGHPLHKGTPREAFVREFLQAHLSEHLGIGTGEIIDAHSRPNEKRNQLDVILYRREYPKLELGGGINCFLAESVVATIEVKSRLTESGLYKAVESAHRTKELQRRFREQMTIGYVPPGILCYVVAYDGPKRMNTVRKWATASHMTLGVKYVGWGSTLDERQKIPSPSLDGVFVLGRGFMIFDNFPVSFLSDERRAQNPEYKWIFAQISTGNLLLLFVLLTVASSGMQQKIMDEIPYLSSFKVHKFYTGP